MLVHNPETICLTYFIDLLLQRGKPIMLVGNAGVGKTILVTDKVSKLREDYMVAKVPFNYYTTSAMLQRKNLFFFFLNAALFVLSTVKMYISEFLYVAHCYEEKIPVFGTTCLRNIK